VRQRCQWSRPPALRGTQQVKKKSWGRGGFGKKNFNWIKKTKFGKEGPNILQESRRGGEYQKKSLFEKRGGKKIVQRGDAPGEKGDKRGSETDTRGPTQKMAKPTSELPRSPKKVRGAKG